MSVVESKNYTSRNAYEKLVQMFVQKKNVLDRKSSHKVRNDAVEHLYDGLCNIIFASLDIQFISIIFMAVGPGGSPDENGETTIDAMVMNGVITFLFVLVN